MTDVPQPPRRLAVVGCGAVTRLCYLPGLVTGGPFRLVALVDRVYAHAAAAAAHYQQLRAARNLPEDSSLDVTDDLDRVLADIDAAVVATANVAHAEVAAPLLRSGIHVLVEKPFALGSEQCDMMRMAAEVGGGLVRPAHVRRLYPSAQWIRALLNKNVLGPVRSIRWSQGAIFGWPMASDFTFHPVNMGGGLLNDMGPHLFDIVLFWFGGPLSVISYGDNSAGGAESEVRLELDVNGIPAEAELSRLRALDNCCIIEGERHTIHVGTRLSAEYTQFDSAGKLVDKGSVPILPPAGASLESIFQEQLVQFDRAISGNDSALATFEDGAATVRLIQACRTKQRRRLPRPWETSRPAPSCPALRVAVTGGTGFIGSHVIERLLTAADTTNVVTVARSLPKLARLSHLLDHSRLRYAHTDILDRKSLVTAFQGCDVIIHTVCGTTGDQKHRWLVTVEGTATVLDAAARAGVRRIVNIGTMAVYDTAGQSILDESCPLLAVIPEDLSYAQQKLVAEQLVIEAAGDSLEVVTLQPTIVYGPWGTTWTLSPLDQLRSGDDVLPSGQGYGVCNAVHVHDVADAVVFLVDLPITDPLRVLVSGPQPVNWGAFYDTYRDLLGVPRPHRNPQEELSAHARLYANQVVVSTQRLASLGFNARIGFTEGMAQLAAWARWAGLTPPINRAPT